MSTSSRIIDVRKREENAPTHLNFGLMCVSDVFCNVEVVFFIVVSSLMIWIILFVWFF